MSQHSGSTEAQQCSTDHLTAVLPLWYKHNTYTLIAGRHDVRANTQRLSHMTQPTPTVTFCIAAAQMSAAWARLTTFLLHGRHAFLHTFHSPEHSALDIFDQHQRLLLRCTFQVAHADAPVPTPPVSPMQGALAVDLTSLLQDLVQGSVLGSSQSDDKKSG